MSEPRWLDADEQLSWRSFLEANRLLFDALEQQLQRDSGIPHAYYEILVRLSEAPGRVLRMSELADTSLSSRSRLSHAVARMEERGWVSRQACDTDRRGSWATLTDAGFAVLHGAAQGHVAAVRKHLVDVLTPEQFAELGRVSEIVRRRLLSVRPPGPVDGAGAGADAPSRSMGR